MQKHSAGTPQQRPTLFSRMYFYFIFRVFLCAHRKQCHQLVCPAPCMHAQQAAAAAAAKLRCDLRAMTELFIESITPPPFPGMVKDPLSKSEHACMHAWSMTAMCAQRMTAVGTPSCVRGAWWSTVYSVPLLDAVGAPQQLAQPSFHVMQQQSRLQQLHPVTFEPVMFAGVGWQCSCSIVLYKTGVHRCYGPS
jgi:hypothetical protein